MIKRRHLVLGAMGGLAAPLYARAQSNTIELSAQYSIPELFRGLMEDVATEFSKRHPNIRVNWRAPEQGYEEIMQRNLRDSITRSLPDVAFHGLNRQRTLLERDIPVDLRPFMLADARIAEQGYSETSAFARPSGWQANRHRLRAFNPHSLLQCGSDAPRWWRSGASPSSWEEVINLSRAIAGLGDNITGMFFDWTITGNWSWQGLVFSHGGRMLNAEETQVAFNQEPGQRAIRTLRRFVDEGRMPDIRPATMFTDFFSGRLGISMQSTAQLGRYNREIGGRFPLLTGRYPLSAPNARIPAGAMWP